MRLTDTTYDNKETGCCARLDGAKWHQQEVKWVDKPFVKDHIREVFHMPINFGAVMTRMHKRLDASAAYAAEPLWLVDEASPWRADIFMATDRDVPNADMARLSGTFLTLVVEGPFRKMGEWIESARKYVAAKGRTLEKLYFFYATCPGCAKNFGKNQVVIFAKVA